MRGKTVRAPVDTQVRIDFVDTNETTWKPGREGTIDERVPCFIPADYMPDPPLRIQAYRALAELSNQKTLKALRNEWRDRYGQLPQPAEHLLTITAIRLAATHRNIESVEVKDSKLQLLRNGDYILANGKFPRLQRPKKEQLEEALELVKSC
jgi:transcription-repair coupling factor (superfamily II helicase)